MSQCICTPVLLTEPFFLNPLSLVGFFFSIAITQPHRIYHHRAEFTAHDIRAKTGRE